jgi:hypothetical protein
MMTTLAMSAMDFELWVEMAARAHPITTRAIAPFVNVKSVFLIWPQTSDRPCDQNRVAHLFEGYDASD